MTTYWFVILIRKMKKKQVGWEGNVSTSYMVCLSFLEPLSLVSFLYDVCGIIEKPTVYLGSLQRNPKKLRRVEP